MSSRKPKSIKSAKLKSQGQPRLRGGYAPLESLRLDPRNARRHPRDQIRTLCPSITQFGFNVPLLVDRELKIVAGHGRYLAAKELGLSEVPVIYLEHLDPDQARAFAIADNRLAELSSWDDRLLAQHLKELSDIVFDFDIEATGFDVGEIDLRIAELDGQGDPSAPDQADEVPETPQEPVTQLGDMWCLGNHRILCANALEGASYQALLGLRRANMVFADPPYNLKIDRCVSGLGAIKHREFAMASGEMSPSSFVEFLTGFCRLLAIHSVDGSLHYLCMDWRHIGEIVQAGNSVYTECKNVCVWVKTNAGMGSFYRSQHELVFVFKKGEDPHRNNVKLGKFGRNRTNVWRYPGANALPSKGGERLLEYHPTVKPIALVADAILDCTKRGDLALDCFLGSGTTLLAAERTGRHCCGLEIDPAYVDVAIARWERMTGEQAIHASGMTFSQLATVRGGHHE